MTSQVATYVTTALCSLLATVLKMDGQARTPPPSISRDRCENSSNSMMAPGPS